jgi:hypothetical protein
MMIFVMRFLRVLIHAAELRELAIEKRAGQAGGPMLILCGMEGLPFPYFSLVVGCGHVFQWTMRVAQQIRHAS